MAIIVERTIILERQGPASHPTGFVVSMTGPDGSRVAHRIAADSGGELDEVVRQLSDVCGDLLIVAGGLLDAEERAQRDGALVLVDEPEG